MPATEVGIRRGAYAAPSAGSSRAGGASSPHGLTDSLGHGLEREQRRGVAGRVVLHRREHGEVRKTSNGRRTTVLEHSTELVAGHFKLREAGANHGRAQH